jgi:hypothetical protein
MTEVPTALDPRSPWPFPRIEGQKRYPCEETTLELDLGEIRVRLWITNHGGARAVLGALLDFIKAAPPPAIGKGNPFEVCRGLAESYATSGMPGLAAVQVTKEVPEGRVGHMIYTEPFET